MSGLENKLSSGGHKGSGETGGIFENTYQSGFLSILYSIG